MFGQTAMAKNRYMHISFLGIYRDVQCLMMVHTLMANNGKHAAPVDSLYHYVRDCMYIYFSYIHHCGWFI